MGHQNRELELKVRLSSADAARLKNDSAAKTMASGPRVRKKLRSIYFDTAKHDLRAAGISLRLRRYDGNWIQTLKADRRIDNGLSNPIEVETPVATKTPDLSKIADKKLAHTVRKAVGKRVLRPVFETVVQRTSRELRARDSVLELAVDEGEVRAGNAKGKVLEAELELKSGGVTGLILAAETLFANEGLQPSTESKADQGYRLIAGEKKADPQKRTKLKLRPQCPIGGAFAAILSTLAEQIRCNRKIVLQSDDTVSPHQMRVGLRRLRSALRILRPLINNPAFKDFETAARDIAACVGRLRDADVLITTILSPVEAHIQDKKGIDQLRHVLVEKQRLARRAVRAYIAGPTWTRLDLYLSLWPRLVEQSADLHQPIEKYAHRVLRKRWRKTAKIARNIKKLTPEGRHAFRKSLKELRYSAEFFAALFNRQLVTRFLDRLETLQKGLGYMNDVQNAGRLRLPETRSKSDRSAAALSYVLGWHDGLAQHAWKRASKKWTTLSRSPRYWEATK